MYTLLYIIIIVAALLLIGVVLSQKSKGRGLAAEFGEVQRQMGIQASAKFVERATLVLAGTIVVLSIACAYLAP